jgi:endonuclease/exonuclease/phosphatase (EEP) superfamily protein YafD
MYFAPLPLVAALFVVSGFWFATLAAWRGTLALVAAAAVALGAWHHNHYFDAICHDPARKLVVLEWNVARGRGVGWPSIAEYAEKTGADVIGLVEAGPSNGEQERFWRQRFPDYQVVLPGGGLALLVKGTVESSRFRQLLGISSMLTAEVAVDGEPLVVVLVDLDASPRFDKRRLNDAILSLVHRDRRAPAVVMGDFNTPIDSRWFLPFRQTMTHAFEAAGHGSIATWPAGFPLLAVDHVWSTPELAASCARIAATGLSDHRSFLAVFALPPRN